MECERKELDSETYARMYHESISNSEMFWGEQARKMLDWYQEWSQVVRVEGEGGSETRWFEGGKLNVSYNCIDRHIAAGNGAKVAYHWEGNTGETINCTYNDLLEQVSRLANVLKARGIKKGDRVCIYMPMIPEAVYAMLACTRIGAVHSVVFGGFSSSSLQARIEDATCSAIITADVVRRGDKVIPLKEQVDKIINDCASVHTCIVVDTLGAVVLGDERYIDYRTAVATAATVCEPESMEAEDPLFILYTSGSTGRPKGVVHTTAGYLLYATVTFQYVFDYRTNDVFWCTADIGWITGHSYLVYGPLASGATSVLFEGVPTYPTAARLWEIVDKYGVTTLYTAPTLIRMLMGQGDDFVKNTSRESLRILGSVGEPINPEAWQWYHDVAGDGRCAIVDTWWQTETGGHALAPIPHVVTHPKPGAAMRPLFGIEPVIADYERNILAGEAEGVLLLRGSWPGRLRDVYNDHNRFLDTYFRPYPGYYFTGDGARRDADGDFWVTGRIDDVMKISGHLIGTAEVESALAQHDQVVESAVVAIPHEIKGGSMCAFVCLSEGVVGNDALVDALIQLVQQQVGSFAKPDHIYFVSALPKTRSGKIMRRILRKVAAGETSDFGDTSTLIDPAVVAMLIAAVGVR